jgi:hypothetical protein
MSKVFSNQTLSIGAQGAQGQVFSLGNLSTITTGINGFFNADEYSMITNSTNIKKYEIIETTEDLLALSCTWYRIRQSKHTLQPHVSSLLSENLFRHVTPEDRTKAEEVRDYYSKKFMVMALKDQRLTQFRQDLKDYLVGDSKKFTEKTVPMVYRLPEFHAHDVEFDIIKRDFEKDIPEFNTLTRRTINKSVRLTPVKGFKKNSKTRGKFTEYWLKDSKNRAYRFGITATNPLIGLWDMQFNNGDMVLNLNIQASCRDELQYFNIGSILEG